MRFVALVASVAVITSCGGGDSSSPGAATFGGSVRGNTFTPHDAISGVVSFNTNGVHGQTAFIAITSAPALCSSVTSGKQARSSQYLFLAPFKVQPDLSAIPPPSPGAYQVGALTLQNGAALFSTTDAACGVVATNTVAASSGTITLTSVGSRYAGSYQLFFDLGDSVSGTFDAPVCAGIDVSALQAGTLACQ
jgi:hypothetical protein